jgi:hypothetical protein
MPAIEEREDSEQGLPPPPMTFVRLVQFWGFAALLVLAGAFYVGWGLSYGVWLDNGVYAVVVVLALMGAAGMWLSLPNPPVADPSRN